MQEYKRKIKNENEYIICKNKSDLIELKNINKRGITLVALVVTITVLVILTGVSINLILDNNGIIKKAKETSENFSNESIEQEKDLDDLSGFVKEHLGEINYKNIDENETNPIDATPRGAIIIENDANKGIVIRISGNEYVWVKVPKTTEIYQTTGKNLDKNSLTSENYTSIEEDLHTYTSEYRDSTSFLDEYYSDETTGLTEEEYNTLKQTMLKSIYTYGGFWIGRYETGIEEQYRYFGTDYFGEHETQNIPVIKSNAYPYNWVRCSQAQSLSSQFMSGDYTSSLMFGVQWDLVLKYLEENASWDEAHIPQYYLKDNSKDWGNYYNKKYEITDTNAKYYIQEDAIWRTGGYNKTESGNVLLSTGASNDFNKMNIYDLAGNIAEWTLEYTADEDSPCSSRGGKYYSGGSYAPVFYRDTGTDITSSNNIGFRVTFFVE